MRGGYRAIADVGAAVGATAGALMRWPAHSRLDRDAVIGNDGGPPVRLRARLVRAQPDLAALPALVARVRETGLAVTLEDHGQPQPVPADLAATAYRIVQESLTNTVRHAAATSARVRLSWHSGRLALEVSDDGRGPSGNGAAGGFGLVGMRERVTTAGGELATGAGADGVGFQVSASLPIPSEPALQ